MSTNKQEPTVTNTYKIEQVLEVAYAKGKTEGQGLSSPIDNAKFIVEAAQSCKIDNKGLQKYYREYARGKNDGNVNGHQIDLTKDNDKSLDAQASKLSIFVKLADKDGGKHANLIERTVTTVLALTGKKPSVYEMVLKACRAQVNGAEIEMDGREIKIGGSRAIADEELVALVTPAISEPTRISQLERAIQTAEGKASLLTEADLAVILPALRTRLILAVNEQARVDLEVRMDTQADELGWTAGEYNQLGLNVAS
jgi:hypothetical protein